MPRCRAFAKGDLEGPQNEDDNDNNWDEPRTAEATFVPGHALLNARIAHLHARLPHDEHAQVKIDAHLPCAAAALQGLDLGKLDLSRLTLLPEDSPQLATLPDLGSAIRSCLVGRQWTATYLHYLLHGCLPCPRPPVKAPQQPDRVSTAICLNLVLATLLGLYPACVKRPPFPVRAALYARVHSLLTSDGDAQAAFAARHQPLLTLALAEYACHVLPAFLPAEYSSLCAAHSVDAFFSAGPPMFDVFRQDHVDSGSESWASLSAAAQDAHERLTRVYRSKCRLPPQPRRQASASAPHATLVAALDVPRITPYLCHRANEGLLRDEYAMLTGDPALCEAASLHALVQIAPLPDNVREMQVLFKLTPRDFALHAMPPAFVLACVLVLLGIFLLLHHLVKHSGPDIENIKAQNESSPCVCYFQLSDISNHETWILVCFTNALSLAVIGPALT